MQHYLLIETKNYRLEDVEGDTNWPYFLQNREGEGMSLSSKDLDCILNDYLQNKKGEGMSLSSKDLDCILDEYFKEHF